jgi:hypothetical protein
MLTSPDAPDGRLLATSWQQAHPFASFTAGYKGGPFARDPGPALQSPVVHFLSHTHLCFPVRFRSPSSQPLTHTKMLLSSVSLVLGLLALVLPALAHATNATSRSRPARMQKVVVREDWGSLDHCPGGSCVGLFSASHPLQQERMS